jgi:tRNA U34 2-thiouridine synthase MnmA/TrmU
MRPPFRAAVKVRSMMEAVPGSVGEDSVELDASVWAPAPGQSAVFYEGDMVLGGGIIREVVIK